MGMVKATLKLDQAPPDVVADRRKICHACPDALPCKKEKNAGLMCKCSLCKCRLDMKTSLAGEQCPAGKWSKVPALTANK
jgi:hypothetical protein